MAGVINTIWNLLLGLLVGAIVAIPIIWIWWKFKVRKIRKKIPEDMLEQVEKYKEDERRLEDERKKRIKSTSRREPSIKRTLDELRRTEKLGKPRDIQTKSIDKPKQLKSDTKISWPKFE